MSQPPKRLPSPDVAGTTNPTKKRSRKDPVNNSGQADDVVRSTSVRVKMNTGRISMRKLKGTARDSQKLSQNDPGTIPAAPDVAHRQGRRLLSPSIWISLTPLQGVHGTILLHPLTSTMTKVSPPKLPLLRCSDTSS